MRRIKARLCPAVFAAGIAAGVVFAITPIACAQVATLGKGHQLLVNNGLQIWGLQTDKTYPLSYSELTAANMNAVVFSYEQSNPGVLSPGQKWGKWVVADPTHPLYTSPATSLDSTEAAHFADLVSIQVGDEQQSDMENPNGYTKAWFDAAHAGNYFTNQLLYVNSFYIGNHAAYADFIINANPDAISWDGYPFGNPHGGYILPKNWLTLGNVFRRHALGTYIGATGASPRPYGMYVQTFHDGVAVDPGEVEIRWQQFAAWTMGYEFVDAFIYRGGNNNFGGQPSGPVYLAFQETARQGRNLGPALTRLISYGYGPSFVQGAGSSGIPGEWIFFDRNNAQPSQRYLTGISNITNLGTKNSGLSGDVYVGFFNPLHLSFGDPAGTTYFMIMNGLGGDLALPNGQSDNTATVAETRQQMTLSFDFGVAAINSLLRLSRNTGLVEVINTGFNDGGNTIFTSLGNGKYQLQLTLDGGTGDLFKYNDGTPFVGAQAAVPLGYWDSDGNAGNNNVTTGSGMGGSGDWGAGSKWHNGVTNSTYAAGSNVVFAGTAGNVTLTSPQSVTSLQFKTSGYTIAGSTLTLNAPTINVDAGVTATISSTLAGSNGFIKNGPGTLDLASAGTYSGNTTINEGVLGIATASLGALPGSPTPNIQINHGSTLRFNADNIMLAANRQVVLGSSGGVLDTNGNNAAVAGVVSGTTLTKIGTGTLTLSGSNTYSSTVTTGGALQVSSDTNLGNAPASFTAGNITLDGGTLRFGANFNIANTRGITINAGGGTIDTQGFTNPAGYNAFQGGFRGPGDLTKIGSGTFFAAAPSGGANVNWKGRLIIKEGTWKIVATDGLPYNVVAADPLQPAQVTLDGGTWQIGATMNVTNGKRGVTITAGGGTIDTQGFNLTWAGPWAGSVTSAMLNKIGSGTLRLNSHATFGPGTYAGNLNVNGGTLQLDGGTAMGDLAGVNLANTAGVSLNITGSVGETIGSLSGGGASGGNLSLSATLTTGGNNNSTTFNGRVSGSSGLTKTGSGTFTLAPLAGGNTYGGTTTVNAGTLLVNNTTGSGTGTGSVVVGMGATLGGTGRITGAVTVNSGAHIAPGASIESLDVGALTLAAGSILDFELDTLLGADTSDLVNVTTSNGLTINGGMLNLTNAGGMTGGTYTLIDYAGSLNGNVSNITLGTTPAGFTYDLVDNTSNKSIDLVVTAPGLAGDFNSDGVVDAADYVVWRKGLGTTYTQNDYNAWRSNFGATEGGSGGFVNSQLS
ncbi:MAG: autotransporter-associated beta strand repeat-containing protein, partial [Pirellulales bacterium]